MWNRILQLRNHSKALHTLVFIPKTSSPQGILDPLLMGTYRLIKFRTTFYSQYSKILGKACLNTDIMEIIYLSKDILYHTQN